MSLFRMQLCPVAAALCFCVAGLAHADETGLADLHEWKKVGKLICFVDHTHYATSTGAPDKKTATAEAVASWQSFTDLEYGSDWASFSKATAKRISCQNLARGWSCDVQARPCR